MFLDLVTDPEDGDSKFKLFGSRDWALDLNFDDPPPLESFDFFLLVFLGMSGGTLAGDPSSPWSESLDMSCRVGLDPSEEESLGLEDLLDCLGLSDFSFVGESAMLPDDGLLDALGSSGKSLP